MKDIWAEVNGTENLKTIMATIVRVVESQEQIATLNLVNDVFEQGILEEMLEASKTPFPIQSESLHYLLKTPFRYPPLLYGSRFGSIYESGIFYGSLNIFTALSETAYYRFVYIMGPEVPFPSTITSELTSFSIAVKSKRGILLDEPPFSEYESILTSPTSYTSTQQLGTHMRQSEVEMFRYISARDKNRGKNMGLFSTRAFHHNKPSQFMGWLCQTNMKEIGFISKEESQRLTFKQTDFWVHDNFPSPAP